jgi:hypothetical protein
MLPSKDLRVQTKALAEPAETAGGRFYAIEAVIVNTINPANTPAPLLMDFSGVSPTA